jgi:hypothetical protein
MQWTTFSGSRLADHGGRPRPCCAKADELEKAAASAATANTQYLK